MTPCPTTRFTGTALPERRPLGTDVTISPCAGDARSVPPSSTVGPSWPNISVILQDAPQPPNHCSFRCPRHRPPLSVAAAAAFVPLVVIATLLLLFAINRFCDLLLVSSRCVVCVYAWLRAWIILGFLGLWNRIWCMSVGFSLY